MRFRTLLFIASLLILSSLSSLAKPSVSRAEVMDEPSRLMDFADGLFAREVYDLAASEYSRLLKKFPNFKKIHLVLFRRGECDYLRAKYAEAIPFYKRVVDQKAEVELTRAGVFRLGSCYYFLSDYDLALKTLAPLHSSDCGEYYKSASAYFLGKCSLALKKVEEAKKYFEAAIGGKEYGHLASYTRAKIALSEEDYSVAVKYFQITIDAKGMVGLGVFAALSQAEAYRKLGDAKKACKVFALLSDLDNVEVAFPAAMKFAIISLQSNEPQAALEILKKVVAKFPASEFCGEAYLLSGRAYAAMKNWLQAKKAFSASLGRKLESSRELVAEEGYLRSLFYLKEYSEMISYSKSISVNPPKRFNSWLLIAEALEMQKEDDKSIGIYKYLQDDGEEPYLRYSRLRYALYLHRLGKDEKAMRASLRFASLYKEDVQTPILLCKAGDSAILLEKFVDAEKIFSTVLQGGAKKREEAYAYFRRAVARYFLGKKMEMASDLKAIENSKHIAKYLDSILLMLGDYEQEREDLPLAIIYFKRLISECPKSRKLLKAKFRLAACYYQRELFEKASETYLGIIKEGNIREVPDDALLWTIQYLAKHEKAQDAIDISSAALTLITGRPELLCEVLFVLAETLENANNHKSAVKYYRQLLAKYPKSNRKYSARFGIARCLRSSGQMSEAEEILKSLLNETTGRIKSEVTLELADLEFSQKRFDEALRDYSFVAILEDEESLVVPALLGAARTCHLLKRYVDATRFASELVEKFPNSPFRKEAEKLITVKKP